MSETSASAAPIAKESRFSLDQSLSDGWHSTWKYFWPYTGVCATTLLIGSIPTAMSIYSIYINSSAPVIALSILIGFVGAIMQDLFQLGYLNLQLRVLDGQSIATRDIFSCTNEILKFIAASFMYKVLTALGYVCFIAPGVIFQLKYQYFGYFIVERKRVQIAENDVKARTSYQ